MPVLLDPTDERKPVTRERTPRPGNLSGVVGLLDISKARGDVFLAHLADELRREHPDIEVRTYRKPTFARPAPADLRRQIARECGFVIEALAD